MMFAIGLGHIHAVMLEIAAAASLAMSLIWLLLHEFRRFFKSSTRSAAQERPNLPRLIILHSDVKMLNRSALLSSLREQQKQLNHAIVTLEALENFDGVAQRKPGLKGSRPVAAELPWYLSTTEEPFDE